MDAPRTHAMYLYLVTLFIATCVASVHNEHPTENKMEDQTDQTFELFDGVYMSIPRENNTRRSLSFEVDTGRSSSEGRGKKKKMMQKLLPIFIMPFILQSALIPFALGFLKFMLIKAVLIGKLALSLIMFNAFKNHNSFKGRDAEIASAHYGYHGNGFEQYATSFNK